MKTLELNLKQRLLIVDAPVFTFGKNKVILSGNFGTKTITGDFEFICHGSELTEEIARTLCKEKINISVSGGICGGYENGDGIIRNAKETFISSVEAKGFYWLVNPISLDREKVYRELGDTFKADGILKCWKEAEAKTFKNPLIFERA